MTSAEQSIGPMLPTRLSWDAGDDWIIDVSMLATGVSHAVTPDNWVTTYELDEPGKPETTELDDHVEVPVLEEVNA